MSTTVGNTIYSANGKLYAGMTKQTIRADINAMTFGSDKEREKAYNEKIKLFEYANSLVEGEVDDVISEKEIEAYNKKENSKKTWKIIGVAALGIGVTAAAILIAKKCNFTKILNKQPKEISEIIPNHSPLSKDIANLPQKSDIVSLKKQLNDALASEYCAMPDYMARIPNGASEEETAALLNKMFEDSKFFSRVSTCEKLYGKNFEFAEMMSDLSSKSSQSISEGKSFKTVLDQIAKGYSKETTINTEFTKRIGKSGIYRGSATKPPEYFEFEDFKFRVDSYETGYGCSGVKDGYRAYVQRLDNTGKRISPFSGFTLTKIIPSNPCMRHPYHEEVAKNMEIISERYQVFQNLVKKYNKAGTLSAEMRKEADDIISEIYYLMANTCPFKRGSNGISDVLMRSQYSALGINMPHIKKGVGLDLEAFCMELGEYKTKWNSFFNS